MTVEFIKKHQAVLIDSKNGRALYILNKVADPIEFAKTEFENIDAIFVSPENFDPLIPEHIEKWGIAMDTFFKKGVVMMYSSGEFRVKDFHISAARDEGSLQFAIETPEGWVQLLNGKPSEAYVKKWAPMDVVIGTEQAVAEVQLDFEPFYVIVPNMTPEYMKTTGITDIKQTDKISLKKMETAAREGTIEMVVVNLS